MAVTLTAASQSNECGRATRVVYSTSFCPVLSDAEPHPTCASRCWPGCEASHDSSMLRRIVARCMPLRNSDNAASSTSVETFRALVRGLQKFDCACRPADIAYESALELQGGALRRSRGSNASSPVEPGQAPDRFSCPSFASAPFSLSGGFGSLVCASPLLSEREKRTKAGLFSFFS